MARRPSGARSSRGPEPGAGQVLVRLRAASLNFRDLMVAKGIYNPRLKLPIIPMSDGAGEVVATGDGATRFKPGDRVVACFAPAWLDGPMTEAGAAPPSGPTPTACWRRRWCSRGRPLIRSPPTSATRRPPLCPARR